jgi:hypothetical protein
MRTSFGSFQIPEKIRGGSGKRLGLGPKKEMEKRKTLEITPDLKTASSSNWH